MVKESDSEESWFHRLVSPCKAHFGTFKMARWRAFNSNVQDCHTLGCLVCCWRRQNALGYCEGWSFSVCLQPYYPAAPRLGMSSLFARFLKNVLRAGLCKFSCKHYTEEMPLGKSILLVRAMNTYEAQCHT